MNAKTEYLMKVIETVVGCCSMEVDGRMSLTKEEVIGESRRQNVVMTRAMCAAQIISMGYSIETVAMVLRRSVRGARDLLANAMAFHRTSMAYRVAEKEAAEIIGK